MPADTLKLRAAAELYFTNLRNIHDSPGATKERSYYTALNNLLNAVGKTLRPKVFAVQDIRDMDGSGHPDFGLYSANQIQRSKPRGGQIPEHGVVEVKPWTDDAWLTADSAQVSKYWNRFRLVLVTNMREFVLLDEDGGVEPVELESLQLAESQEEFERLLETPRAFANRMGVRLGEYLIRVLSYRASITEPRDLAHLLASYARDGLARVEATGDAPSLSAVRSALEDALGVRFEGDRGAAFFRSTLVQTLFYGVFSAWVIWARRSPGPNETFNWHETGWLLHVPVLQALFQQLSNPRQLQSLGLVELMDWTAAALNRVRRDEFFDRFSEGEAVQYFYEPFLQEFDPALRKQLGVWYTPPEVVRYMVARVDRALKDDLGIADGLAADNVYVLDPCCGTGAYVAEVLRRIYANLKRRGVGANLGALVKKAATERVFGFEIMPAPFVVAHLQVGLTMSNLEAPFSDDGTERTGIFLTNALTGWEPRSEEKKPLPFLELEEERDRADTVKQETPILVILGNPPYNGYAGMAVGEERELSNAYRTVKNVRRPEGQGLNELYVRFFRMAERRIAEKTGQGVVCFISNYSWLDGLSFTGMRERFLEAFDAIHIDSLNGDKFRTGKTTPDGKPDPSIFSTPEDPVGIQVGTAVATLIRKRDHKPTDTVGIRQLWGVAKPAELTKTADSEPDELYDNFQPDVALGLPFAPMTVSDNWSNWPALPELFSESFPGVKTSRDSFLVDIDEDQLRKRIAEYFDPEISDEEIGRRYPAVMRHASRFDARGVRSALHSRSNPQTRSGLVPYAYRPFDNRWLYWEAETKLLDEKRPEYKPHAFEGNIWFSTVPRIRRSAAESQSALTSHLASLHLNEWGSSMFPLWLRDDMLSTHDINGTPARPNLTHEAQAYLDKLGMGVEDLFYHTLAVLHDPAYREQNAGALRMEWPRIPLPGWPDGDEDGAADKLRESAAKGRQLAVLLDSDTSVDGVTTVPLRPEIAAIGVPTAVTGNQMNEADRFVTAGWGHLVQGGAVMPGQGRVEQRDYTAQERAVIGETTSTLGKKAFDVYLNDDAYWRNVPDAVWNYKLGGYQVLKKWLSYRESKVLGRSLKPDEVQHFTNTVRRIAAILLLTGGG